MADNNSEKNSKQIYSESGGTGMLGVFLFTVFMIIAMLIIAHFKG